MRSAHKMFSAIECCFAPNKFSLLEAPSGFGKTQLMKYGADVLGGLYVDSNPSLFDGSVNENIRLGDTVIDGYQSLLADLNFALDEHIMNINEKLSTGQKQRISFLRSLQANTRVILFDETLSGCQSNLIDATLIFAKQFLDICCNNVSVAIVNHNYNCKLPFVNRIDLIEYCVDLE